jgi:hypothetical protein
MVEEKTKLFCENHSNNRKKMTSSYLWLLNKTKQKIISFLPRPIGTAHSVINFPGIKDIKKKPPHDNITKLISFIHQTIPQKIVCFKGWPPVWGG